MTGSAALCAGQVEPQAPATVPAVPSIAQMSHAPRNPLVLRDDLQRDVAFPQIPQRIISLLPSLTETVCALGACHRLVATDRFSDWPPQTRSLPKAGGLDDASIEMIASLRPDLVLLSRSQQITQRLHELGIVSFALTTDRYTDIGRTTLLMGRLLGVPERAALLVHAIDNEVGAAAVEALERLGERRPSVYFEVEQAGYAAGPESYIGELLARLGTRNIVTADLGAYPELNPEYVVRHNPDVVFVAPSESNHLAQRPGWDSIRAVKEKRVCSFAAEVRDTIVRPGPRVAEGMLAMAAMPGAGRPVTPPKRLALWIGACAVLTLTFTFASLLIGTSALDTSLHWLSQPDDQGSVVLWQIRLPRTLGAWCVGALLGLCGALAQGVFRNPLAEPYLLGTASGAALGVAVSLIAADSSLAELEWAGRLGVTGAACLGAGVATALTLALSRGVLQTTSLLLAGIVVAFVLSAVTSLVLLTRPQIWRAMQSFVLGSTGFIGWSAVTLLATVLCICLIPALALSRGLDALTLGEDTARSLGLSLAVLRLTLLAVVSLGTAAAVGQVGVVGFVGLMAPHLVRETSALNHRQLLLAASVCGGTLLQAADLLSRWIVRPAELPVGAVTACIGGAYLIVLLWRRNTNA